MLIIFAIDLHNVSKMYEQPWYVLCMWGIYNERSNTVLLLEFNRPTHYILAAKSRTKQSLGSLISVGLHVEVKESSYRVHDHQCHLQYRRYDVSKKITSETVISVWPMWNISLPNPSMLFSTWICPRHCGQSLMTVSPFQSSQWTGSLIMKVRRASQTMGMELQPL
jgi:hypothetical protein